MSPRARKVYLIKLGGISHLAMSVRADPTDEPREVRVRVPMKVEVKSGKIRDVTLMSGWFALVPHNWSVVPAAKHGDIQVLGNEASVCRRCSGPTINLEGACHFSG